MVIIINNHLLCSPLVSRSSVNTQNNQLAVMEMETMLFEITL